MDRGGETKAEELDVTLRSSAIAGSGELHVFKFKFNF